MGVEEKSLRDELTAAFDKAETPAGPAKETTTPAVESPPVVKSEEKKDDTVPVGSKPPVDSNVPGVDGKTPDSGKPASDTKSEPAADKPSASLDPPVSLKAAERSEWAKAPKAIQEAFIRRETEVQTALRQSAESRKLADEFNQIVGPFMPLIRAQNSTPMVAFKNLMNTAAGLTVGTAQQKAQIIRDIIQNYGVDIATLDQVLSNNLPHQEQRLPGTSDVEVQVQRALAPVYEFMNGFQQQRQQLQDQQSYRAEQAVAAFKAKNPYFEEVRYDMADMMDLAAQRNREMTMQEAYDACIALNPQIKAAIEQEKAKQSNQQAERSQRASLSIAGSPAGTPVKDTSKNSLRDDLMDAWNTLANKN